MHLQQTKRASRKSGGPQYYFHDLADSVKTFLRKKGAVQVALITPYGATKSHYFAVSLDKKLDKNRRLVPGSVGHDRIQQGIAKNSIGEAIRKWYKLNTGDFERVDIDIDIIDDIFYLTPLRYKFAGRSKKYEIQHNERPLSIRKNIVSNLWQEQISKLKKEQKKIVDWSRDEIGRVISAHRKGIKCANVSEKDLLRASGPLKHLGIALGPYLQKGYDCNSEFSFLNYPTYTVPIEIKRSSSGFKYQQGKYGKDELSRAVILCVDDDLKHIPKNVDIINLESLYNFLSQ